MKDNAAVERDTLEGKPPAVPYPPSWVDRLTDWVDRLPGPGWMFYAGLWLLLYLIEIATQWTAGTAFTFQPFHTILAGTVVYYLALIHYLDRTAAAALGKFRLVLDCSDADYALIRYRLTTLPARPTLIATLAGAIWAGYLLITWPLEFKLRFAHVIDTPVSIYYITAVGFISVLGLVAFVYHTLHQLVIVSQTYQRARINLFNQGPLYVFSDLSARTAIGVAVFTYGWYATAPDLFNSSAGIFAGSLILIFTIITFIWPLLGVHNLLVAEKTRLLNEASQQLEVTIAELHERINRKPIQGIDDLHKALASLEIEVAALNRISTWPWQTETLRWLIATLLFPIIVWFIQWVLGRILTP